MLGWLDRVKIFAFFLAPRVLGEGAGNVERARNLGARLLSHMSALCALVTCHMWLSDFTSNLRPGSDAATSVQPSLL